MKSSYICILFVFAFLISSAQSNTCSKCWTIGETKCCGDKTMQCPSSSCMTVSESCIVDGVEHGTIRKTCGDKKSCGMCFSVSTNQGLTVLASTQCREGEKSNADLDYKITCEALKKENGYWCPACYKNNSMDGCEAKHKINCRGAETECVQYEGKVQLSDGVIKEISVKGCIMENGCALGFAALPGASEMARKKFICTPAMKKSGKN